MKKRKSFAALLGAACVILLTIGSSPALAQTDDEVLNTIRTEELQLSTGKTMQLDIDEVELQGASAAQKEGSLDLSMIEGGTLNYTIPEEFRDAQFDTPPYNEEMPAGTAPDIPEISPFSVIGTDSRVKVHDTTQSPYIHTPLILYERGGKNYMCTGWLFGTYAVGTAGHCLYQDGEYSTNFQVVFGANGFTAVAACTVDHTSVPSAWTASQSAGDDWGVIQVNCNAGQVFGSFGYKIPPVGAGEAGLSVTGYPADKVNATAGYTMWTAYGPIINVTSKRALYDMDTAGGQSGGPVWKSESSCGNCVSVIHAYGVGGGSSSNSGTRITSTVFSFYAAYAAGRVYSV